MQLDATEVFYCRSYCQLHMFRATLCPSSGAKDYYTVVAACGISCIQLAFYFHILTTMHGQNHIKYRICVCGTIQYKWNITHIAWYNSRTQNKEPWKEILGAVGLRGVYLRVGRLWGNGVGTGMELQLVFDLSLLVRKFCSLCFRGLAW